jgi:methionyl-tRNA synthetase
LVNKFVQDTESWKLIKQDKSKWEKILQTCVWLIHKINLLSSFFMIHSYWKINSVFNFEWFDNSVNFDWFEDEFYKNDFEIKANAKIVFEKLEEDLNK